MVVAWQDPLAMVVTLVCATAWLKVTEFLAEAKTISSNTCRKCIHIGTGPMYVGYHPPHPKSPWH